MSIGTVTNVSVSGGYFTVEGTDTSGNAITTTISFQEYILLFTEVNMKGVDDAIAAMYDNTKHFSVTLQEISGAVSALNTIVGTLKDPDDRATPSAVLTPVVYKTWQQFFDKYKNVVDLGVYVKQNNADYRAKLSEIRAALDNLNEFQTTISNKSEQWNTRTSSVVNARGTAVDLAKTLLGYIKDAMSATVIR
ncbi:MAG: hypothetical protein K2M30_00255 [Desulfovibrionaceae bacterium]|nr:hypothetical protein [Desulfovibrionaceae bacterium]